MSKKNLKSLAGLLFMVLVTMLHPGCFGGSDSAETTGESSDVSQLFVVSEGTALTLYYVSEAGTAIKIGTAEIPPAGLLSEHAIFGITKHPTKPWIYVGSLNECSKGDNACWGNARIDRFLVTPLGLIYAGVAFTYGPGSGPDCADEDWGYPGQTGACAPTTLAFSSDGLRAYVDDDDDDEIHIFAVDPVTGDLTFLWFGANTRLNGLSVSPNDGYLYNGRNILEIVGDTANNLNWDSGNRGNATEVVNYMGVNLLATTWSNNTLEVYDLVDQSAPALIDSLLIPDSPNYCWGPGSAVFQDSSADASLFVVVGAESVATVSFDGTTLTLLDQIVDIDGDVDVDVINRGVAVTADGRYAVVTWFIFTDADCETIMQPTGGITTYAIAADGTLTQLGTELFSVPSRAVLAVPFF